MIPFLVVYGSTSRNEKLLSFGADEGAAGDDVSVSFKKKAIFRPDCARIPSHFQFDLYTHSHFVLNFLVVADPEQAINIPDFVSQPAQVRQPEANTSKPPELTSKTSSEVFPSSLIFITKPSDVATAA